MVNKLSPLNFKSSDNKLLVQGSGQDMKLNDAVLSFFFCQSLYEALSLNELSIKAEGVTYSTVQFIIVETLNVISSYL